METGNVATDGYLLRQEQAAQSLPAGRRVESVAEIRANIDQARQFGVTEWATTYLVTGSTARL